MTKLDIQTDPKTLFQLPSALKEAGKQARSISKVSKVIVFKGVNDLKKVLTIHELDTLQSLVDFESLKTPQTYKVKSHDVHLIPATAPEKAVEASLSETEYSTVRDHVGAAFVSLAKKKNFHVDLVLAKVSEAALHGALVGAGLGSYSFKHLENPWKLHIVNEGPRISPKLQQRAIATAEATNLARHLVNLGPNMLYPHSFCESAKMLFQGTQVKVTVWDEKKLQSEKLNLLYAVGASSAHQPRLLRLSVRHNKQKKAKIVFVGKGITFDSGGLDIKPPQYMRLMKKDMGGSASVLGLAYYLSQVNVKANVDFYIALAENAVGANAFRPGDIYESRKGHVVEIDNTDAEGRLALADAITVAIEENEPDVLIDLATLTGAGKVALGADIASLFSNDEKLKKALMKSSQKTGDWSWPMPLHTPFESMFASHFADFQNSAATGYGGAITAALFLKKFVDSEGKTPRWAHLDIYGWKDRSSGGFEAPGGNGQSVQSLIHFLEAH